MRPRLALSGAVQSLLHRRGLELGPYPPGGQSRRARLLASRGIDVVLDVGANVGQYGLELRAAGYEGRIVSFEPLSQAFAELSRVAEADGRWECRRLALASSEGSAEINVSGNSYSSSLLEMKDRHLRSAPDSAYTGTEKIPLGTLDSIWQEVVREGERPYLKLDVQGFELEVLRGASASLGEVAAVQSELSLVPLYEGAPLFGDLIDYLQAHGFRLAGLEPGFEDPRSGELLQADGIFVRTG